MNQCQHFDGILQQNIWDHLMSYTHLYRRCAITKTSFVGCSKEKSCRFFVFAINLKWFLFFFFMKPCTYIVYYNNTFLFKENIVVFKWNIYSVFVANWMYFVLVVFAVKINCDNEIEFDKMTLFDNIVVVLFPSL